MKVVNILNLGISNLTSVSNSIRDLDLKVLEVRFENVESLSDCDVLVLPGTGHFGTAVSKLDGVDLRQRITEFSHSGGPILGLCLGMQLLFERSAESPNARGLGLLEGNVEALPRIANRGVHIGWSETMVDPEVRKATSLESMEMYFLHSFHCVPKDQTSVAYRSTYEGFSFVAGVRDNNLVGLQFHPEKSSKAGAIVLGHELGRLLA